MARKKRDDEPTEPDIVTADGEPGILDQARQTVISAMHKVKDHAPSFEGAKHMGGTMMHAVQANPLAAVMAGVGLFWLMRGASQSDAAASESSSMLGDSLHENAHLIGGLALVLGAGLACLVPETSVENKLFGKARESLMAQLKSGLK